jgi:N-acetylmuramoyl-L-alanine amidase
MILLLPALLLVFPLSAQEGYITLEDLLSRTDTRLQWDSYRGQGALVRGGSMLTFSLHQDAAVVNFQQVYPVEPPRRLEGALEFPRSFLNLALRIFPPVTRTRRIAAFFIDPGHGGKDPGAVGTFTTTDGNTRVLQEKDVVLDVAKRLKSLLEMNYPDREVVLSRESDEYLTLEERTNVANAIDTESNETVVFVSVHANASLNRNATGFEVWFLPPEFRRRDLVNRENTGVDDPDVLSILNTMREEEITIESILLARNVLTGLESRIGGRSPNRGLREESWYVVRNAKMPSILIEVGFVTNRDESTLLSRPEYLQELSEGIYTGLENFVRNYEELGIE